MPQHPVKIGGTRPLGRLFLVQITASGLFDAIPATVSTDTSSGPEEGQIESPQGPAAWMAAHPGLMVVPDVS